MSSGLPFNYFRLCLSSSGFVGYLCILDQGSHRRSLPSAPPESTQGVEIRTCLRLLWDLKVTCCANWTIQVGTPSLGYDRVLCIASNPTRSCARFHGSQYGPTYVFGAPTCPVPNTSWISGCVPFAVGQK